MVASFSCAPGVLAGGEGMLSKYSGGCIAPAVCAAIKRGLLACALCATLAATFRVFRRSEARQPFQAAGFARRLQALR